MFKDKNLKSTDTSFINQLRQLVPHEQCQEITDEVVITMEKKKEEFYKGSYHTLQEVMVDKYGYVTDKAIERAERKLAKLKQLRNQVSSIAGPKQTNKNQHQ